LLVEAVATGVLVSSLGSGKANSNSTLFLSLAFKSQVKVLPY